MSFTWVPFYREVAARVLEHEERQDELLNLLREMKAAGLPTVPMEHDKPTLTPIEAIDPFTFMANFARTLDPSCFRICEWIRDKWEIKAPVPTDFDGRVGVQSNYWGSWFFGELEGQSQGDNQLLWRLARQAYDGDVEAIDATLFQQCLNRPNLRMRKLTFGMSWVNPAEFLPIRNSVLRFIQSRGVEFKRRAILDGDLVQYADLRDKVRQINPDFVAFVAETQNDESETMNFTWVPFYREVAAHVLEYEDRQAELLAFLYEMKEQGLNPILLNDRDDQYQMIALAEIDPFTFFASWNRGSKDSSRLAICQFLKEKWSLNSAVPSDFDGIPTVNPQSSWFFAYLRTRESHDIKALWRIASAAFENELEEIAPDEWSQALGVTQVGVAKLTMGLFWIAPQKFLTLDAHTVNYVRKFGIVIEKSDLDKKKLTIERYGEIMDEIHNHLGNDNLKISLDAYDGEAELEEEIIPIEIANFPLNQILYGPPGTGKTYSTIERAVEIIDGVAACSHGEAKARFDELRKSGQIEFVTFHQSFSYEEFIEGLRPILDEDGEGTARYEVRDGVLKTLALRALASALEKQDVERATFDQLWNQLLEKIEDEDWILPGLGTSKFKLTVTSAGNLTGSNVAGKAETRFSASRAKVEKVWAALRDEANVTHATITQVLKVGAHTNLIGAVVEEIKRVSKQPKLLIAPQIENSSGSAQSFLHNSPDYRANFTNAPRYVLIVDEINRGNISKILGELITLLEPDKRIGADNELRVQLPVSGEQFALPPNLYLLGTMNTADKSLALLDVALRRRFDFIEMAPDRSLFPSFARDVLTQLNLRLEAALDREHRIGHAVFIGCDENQFNDVFRKKIIPLLQEFFYNDWETLRAVLGESGDSGRFIKKLVAPSGMKARTKWRWWFDEAGTGEFDILATLRANYGL